MDFFFCYGLNKNIRNLQRYRVTVNPIFTFVYLNCSNLLLFWFCLSSGYMHPHVCAIQYTSGKFSTLFWTLLTYYGSDNKVNILRNQGCYSNIKLYLWHQKNCIYLHSSYTEQFNGLQWGLVNAFDASCTAYLFVVVVTNWNLE